MNSKQLNFYAHPKEINEFINFFVLNDCLVTFEPFRKKSYQFIQNDDFLSTDEDVFKIILTRENEKKGNIATKFIASQGYNLFESIESNLIQFSFPKIRNSNHLYRSRFYFVTAFWQNGVLVKKDPQFIEWGTSLFNKFKSIYLKSKEPFNNEYTTQVVMSLVDEKMIELKVI